MGFLIAIAGGLAFVTVAVLVLSQLQLQRTRAELIAKHGCKPANHYKHTIPFLGLDYLSRIVTAYKESRLLDMWVDDLDRYGKTYQFSALGLEIISSKDPELLRDVVADMDAWGVAPFRHEAWKPFLGDSFFTIDGPKWKHGRQMTRPVFTRAEFSDLDRIESHVEKFLKQIPRDGSTVDMEPLGDNLMQDIGTHHFFGAPPDSKDVEYLRANLTTVSDQMLKQIVYGDLVHVLPVPKAFANASRVVHKYINDNIDACISKVKSPQQPLQSVPKKHRNFIEDMVNETQDRKLILDSAVTLYIGSTDTTSAMLNNIWWRLSQSPEVVVKLRNEIDSVPGTEKPTMAQLGRMPYLKGVINETFRLYPIVPFNLRAALKDTVIPRGGGVDGESPLFVKKGTRLLMMYRPLYREESIWGPDALEFKPERWLGKNRMDTWQFQPFSAGPRSCPGQYMALTNLSYIVTRVLQEFEGIESRDDSPWTENMKLTVGKANGSRVAFKVAA